MTGPLASDRGLPKGSRAITLPGGAVVQLHPMQAEDAEALVRFHHSLSRDTTYLRFFSVHPELSDEEVHRFTHVDHRDREALVATIGDDIAGVARFDRLEHSGDAEVAFVVADRWQGQGLGAVLFDALAARARSLGISRFVADTLPHNRRMLNVFHHRGLPCTSELRDGVVHIEIDLGGATPPAR